MFVIIFLLCYKLNNISLRNENTFTTKKSNISLYYYCEARLLMLRLDLGKLTVGLQQRHIYRQKNNFDTLFIKPGTALFLRLESTIINTISRGFFYFFFIPVLLQHKSYFQSIPQQQMGMRAPALNT